MRFCIHNDRLDANLYTFWEDLSQNGYGQYRNTVMKPSAVDLVSIWDRSALDLGSICVDLGSIWCRFGLDLGSIWGRSGVDLWSIHGQKT